MKFLFSVEDSEWQLMLRSSVGDHLLLRSVEVFLRLLVARSSIVEPQLLGAHGFVSRVLETIDSVKPE